MTVNVTFIIFAMEGASSLVACRVLKPKVSKGAVLGKQEFVLAMFFFQITRYRVFHSPQIDKALLF